MLRSLGVLGSLGLATQAWAVTDCDSLLAARISDEALVFDCDVPLGALAPPYCLPASTADACAAAVYSNPGGLTLASNPAHELEGQWLTRCPDGTNVCAPEDQMVCNDGTRPMAYWDQAVDAAGADLVSDDWVFFFGAEGKPCAGDQCWDVYMDVDATFQQAMSNYHPDYAPEAGRLAANGLMSARPVIGTASNPFASFNRVKLNRCSDGASDAYEVIDTDADPLLARTAPVYHHGARMAEGLLNHVDVNGLGPLPPLADATHILLAGSSDGSTWLVQNADRLAAQLAVLAPGAEVRIVIDANFKPMLEGETRYNPNVGTGIFDHVWGNPGGRSLPSDGSVLTSDLYDTTPFLGLASDSWAVRNVQLDATCETAHGSRDPICHDMQHVLLNHVSTPFFLVADQRDPNVSDSSLYAFDARYKFPLLEYRRRVVDQALAVLSRYPSGDSVDPIGIGWSSALYLVVQDDAKHTHFEDDLRFVTSMDKCNAAAPIASWTLSSALHSWLTLDTRFDAVERPLTGGGVHWVTTGAGGTVCGSPR